MNIFVNVSLLHLWKSGILKRRKYFNDFAKKVRRSNKAHQRNFFHELLNLNWDDNKIVDILIPKTLNLWNVIGSRKGFAKNNYSIPFRLIKFKVCKSLISRFSRIFRIRRHTALFLFTTCALKLYTECPTYQDIYFQWLIISLTFKHCFLHSNNYHPNSLWWRWWFLNSWFI